MASNVVPPVYSQIALDIALRITRGELKVNTRIYGRSVMSSEYGVSPETIRRAMKLLEDMEIVEIRQNSGALILSAEKAQEYVERFSAHNDIRSIQKRFNELLQQQQDLCRQIAVLADSIVRINEKFSKTNPFNNYEVAVPPESPCIGKTLSDIKFWQETGATVIAIRRGGKIVLSPGPYMVLQSEDIIIFAGDLTTVDTVHAFLG